MAGGGRVSALPMHGSWPVPLAGHRQAPGQPRPAPGPPPPRCLTLDDAGAGERGQQLQGKRGKGRLARSACGMPSSGRLRQPSGAAECMQAAAAAANRMHQGMQRASPLACASCTASICSRLLRLLSCTFFSAYSWPSCARRASSTVPPAQGGRGEGWRGGHTCGVVRWDGMAARLVHSELRAQATCVSTASPAHRCRARAP